MCAPLPAVFSSNTVTLGATHAARRFRQSQHKRRDGLLQRLPV